MRRGLLVFTFALVACSTPQQGGGVVDAAPRPDVAVGAVDAAVGSVDAAVGPVDAAVASVDAAVASVDASLNSAKVVVHYPAGAGHHISIRGNGAGLTWDDGVDAVHRGGDEWVLDLPVSTAIELKPLHDDQSWAVGPNWRLTPGQTLDVWPYFFHQSGRIEVIDDFRSTTLGNTRDLQVYLPPSYDENTGRRYPVVYMHDGQNLFHDQDSFGGVSWNVAGAMDQGAANATIHEAIIVGIDNNRDRIWEYTPVADPGYGGGGGDMYLKFVATELKPAIDVKYRTLTGREHTGMIGSSLGGLISAYAGVARPEVFGLIGAMSPSTWWHDEWIIDEVNGAATFPARMYVDSGNAGPSMDDYANTMRLAAVYQAHQVPLEYVVQQGGQHNESYWRQRLPRALGFLLGAR